MKGQIKMAERETSGKISKPRKIKPPEADGHRERMREQLIRSDEDAIEDHHLLEMLLFYSIPVRDTRDQAVGLINRFGSLSGVFEAEFCDLLDAEGIGRSSAILIRLVGILMRRVNRSGIKSTALYKTSESIGEMFCRILKGVKGEALYIAAFGSNHRLLATSRLNQTRGEQVNVRIKEIVRFALNNDAAYIAVAHNHQSGILLPSMDDLEFTDQLKTYLEGIDVTLAEHIICGGDGYYPILKNRGL